MAVLYHIECEVRCRQDIDGLETCETRARIETGEKTAVIVSLQFKLEIDLRLYLGFMGGVRLELGGVRVVMA